ncbi:MAG: hypothetical protein HQM11_11470 [SAR324 cluster bacterium]|nr:hypothetical protein [SAR324 cluster bacterium]
MTIENNFLIHVFMGLLSFWGIQGAIALAVRHQALKDQPVVSACDRVLASPRAFILKIPVAYFAALFYAIILGQLLHMLTTGRPLPPWLALWILAGFLVTTGYAWLLFVRLKMTCVRCTRLYLINYAIVACHVAIYWTTYLEFAEKIIRGELL